MPTKTLATASRASAVAPAAPPAPNSIPAVHSPATVAPAAGTFGSEAPTHTKQECDQAISAVRDTLYVLGGKWKLPIISALVQGPRRFKELQKVLEEITPKILSKELKELELNEFVTRTVYATSPVTVEYELTAYSKTLEKVLIELRDWGVQHRKRIKECSKVRRAANNGQL